MFPQSDTLRRLSLAVLLVGALCLSVALAQQFEDDAHEESEFKVSEEDKGTWSGGEDKSEFESKEDAHERDVDIGTLLEFYKEYHRPTQGEDEDEDDDEDEDGKSRLSLFEIVGRVQNKMRRGKNFPRSIFYDCPTKAAKHDPRRRSRMLLYNPANRRTYRIEETGNGGWENRDVESFKRHGFDLNKPTLAIMGGYLQTELSEWIVMFKRRVSEMMSKNGWVPFNLLIYDWAAYSLDFYELSVSFVPHMGSVLAKFFENLIDNHGYKVSQIQLVSFSLSTHITGNAGRQLKSKYGEPIPVIHALDPTGVCFHGKQHGNSTFSNQYALRPTDAKLVLARHYNMEQLGAGRLIGGVDIVVNDGKTQPVMFPERLTMRNLLAGVGIFIASHMRAVDHEVTNVPEFSNECHEIAYECSSYKAFNEGECGHCRARNESCFHLSTLGNFRMEQRPAEMNFELGTVLYVTTGRTRYCEHTFQVVARLDEPPREIIDDFKSGKFKLKIGDVEINPTHHISGDKKELFTQLLRPSRLPAPFPGSVQVKESSLRPLLKSVKYIALTHMSHISREVRHKHSIKYCPDESSQGTLVKCK